MSTSPSIWGSEDVRWMRRALRLASLSLGHTAPNPGVGCVIVRDGQLLGEGRHKRCGEAHGEIQALASVAANGHDPAGATVYVTLAPCTSQGRTPACSAALIRAGVGRVVAAIPYPIQLDPAKLFADAGIAYALGCESSVATRLHGGWLKRVTTGLPRCTGKWAMSLDGFIADIHGAPIAISGAQARQRSRRRRRAYDAIVVGSGTVLTDDPQLLATSGKSPTRVVLSSSAQLKQETRLVTTLSKSPVVLIHDHHASEANLLKLQAQGVETISVDDAHDPLLVKQALGDKGFNDLLVEGGSAVHGSFLAAGAYDRLEIDIGAHTLGSGIPVSQTSSMTNWTLESAACMRGETQCVSMTLPSPDSELDCSA